MALSRVLFFCSAFTVLSFPVYSENISGKVLHQCRRKSENSIETYKFIAQDSNYVSIVAEHSSSATKTPPESIELISKAVCKKFRTSHAIKGKSRFGLHCRDANPDSDAIVLVAPGDDPKGELMFGLLYTPQSAKWEPPSFLSIKKLSDSDNSYMTWFDLEGSNQSGCLIDADSN